MFCGMRHRPDSERSPSISPDESICRTRRPETALPDLDRIRAACDGVYQSLPTPRRIAGREPTG